MGKFDEHHWGLSMSAVKIADRGQRGLGRRHEVLVADRQHVSVLRGEFMLAAGVPIGPQQPVRNGRTASPGQLSHRMRDVARVTHYPQDPGVGESAAHLRDVQKMVGCLLDPARLALHPSIEFDQRAQHCLDRRLRGLEVRVHVHDGDPKQVDYPLVSKRKRLEQAQRKVGPIWVVDRGT